MRGYYIHHLLLIVLQDKPKVEDVDEDEEGESKDKKKKKKIKVSNCCAMHDW